MLGCGRTLVDTSNWSAKVLVINPGPDVVVLPPFSCVGNVVQVSGYHSTDNVDSTRGQPDWASFPTFRGYWFSSISRSGGTGGTHTDILH